MAPVAIGGTNTQDANQAPYVAATMARLACSVQTGSIKGRLAAAID